MLWDGAESLDLTRWAEPHQWEGELHTPEDYNMTMETQPIEDVCPIKNDDVPLQC